MSTARRACVLLMTVLLAGAPALGSAMESHGATFPDQARLGTTDVLLRGTAKLVWKWMFNIEVGALYAPPGDPLADVPKRIEFHYLRDFSAKDLTQAMTECFDDNLDAATVKALTPDLEQLNKLFPAVKSGEHLSITYVPGTGVTVIHQGKELGTVAGSPAFGRGVFAIWLGAKTFDNRFRDGMLGKR